MTRDDQWEEKARQYADSTDRNVYFGKMVRALLRIIDGLRKK